MSLCCAASGATASSAAGADDHTRDPSAQTEPWSAAVEQRLGIDEAQQVPERIRRVERSLPPRPYTNLASARAVHIFPRQAAEFRCPAMNLIEVGDGEVEVLWRRPNLAARP